jgi:hypothetical protein
MLQGEGNFGCRRDGQLRNPQERGWWSCLGKGIGLEIRSERADVRLRSSNCWSWWRDCNPLPFKRCEDAYVSVASLVDGACC